MWESVYRAIVFLEEKSPVIDWGCSTWDNCQNKTAWTVHDIYEWGTEEAGERWKRAEERKSGKMEEWGWPVRWGERKNFSMMKQSVLLSYWPTLPPIARPAPWQQALSPREKQPYRATPPYFSLPFTLMIPSPFPIYKRAGFTSVRARQHKPNTPYSTIHQKEGQHTRNPQCYACYIHRFNGAHAVIRTRSRVVACTKRALPFLMPLLAWRRLYFWSLRWKAAVFLLTLGEEKEDC